MSGVVLSFDEVDLPVINIFKIEEILQTMEINENKEGAPAAIVDI